MELKFGDIIITEGNKFVRLFYSLFDKTIQYTHTALVISPNLIIHSSDDGIELLNFKQFTSLYNNFRILRINKEFTKEDKQAILKRGLKRIGVKYSYLRIVLFFIQHIFKVFFNYKNNNSHVCTTFVGFLYKGCNMKVNNKNWNELTPIDYNKDKNLKIICEFKK